MPNFQKPRRSPGSVQPFVNLNPAPVVNASRPPATNDYYEPSTIWCQANDGLGNAVNAIYIEASVQDGVANWINIAGGNGVFNDIHLPNTNAAQTQGVIFFGGQRFVSNFGTFNTFVGEDSGNSTLTGIDNSAFGSNAGGQLTTGSNNTFVGNGAGGLDTTGSRNTAVGNGALLDNTSGSDNTALGEEALSSNTTANQSTAVGSQALLVATAGELTAVGYAALTANTTGLHNTALGWNAGAAIDTTNDNTCVGFAAYEVGTGQANTAVGSDALASATTADDNTALGSQALANVLTGDGNIAIGESAGRAYVAAESNNICIGNIGTVGDDFIIRLGTSGTHLETNTAGDLFSELGVFASGDSGAGLAGTTGFTNVVNTTQGAGALTLLSTNGNSGTNTGFIKGYVNGVAVYIPYFLNIAP